MTIINVIISHSPTWDFLYITSKPHSFVLNKKYSLDLMFYSILNFTVSVPSKNKYYEAKCSFEGLK